MSGFPQAIAEAQRASVAADIREAYDRLDHLYAGLNEIAVGGPHLIGLKAAELADLRKRVSHAKESLFHARTVIEIRPDL